MLTYELRLAVLSFRKNPILTGLMIAAVALGIGVCMTTLTVFYLMSGDPIPHKSDQLFAVQLDSWNPNDGYGDDDETYPDQLTWTDAMALLNEGPDVPRTAMFKSGMIVEQEGARQQARQYMSRLTTRDFFDLFDVPFVYGSSWNLESEQNAEQVVVLSRHLNEDLFGGEDSTGRMLRIDDRMFRVVGVIDNWHPSPKFYDVSNGPFIDPEDFYIPITLTIPLEIQTAGNTNCWKSPQGEGFSALLNSECIWIQFWVELNDTNSRDAYETFLTAHVTQQKEFGRFPRPLGVRLNNVGEWLDRRQVVSDDSQVLVGLAFMFLAVCVFNTVGLLLAKFLGRASETGVRRALGATRRMIFRQHLVEVAVIGLSGGLLGLLLAYLGLNAVRTIADTPEALIQLNPELMMIAITLAVGATIIAGIYPSWRIGHTPPARYLKSQ